MFIMMQNLQLSEEITKQCVSDSKRFILHVT